MFCGPIRSSTTTGVTNPLAILQLVAHQIAGTFTRHADALRRVADAMAARLAADIGVELYELLGRPNYADVIGRGPAYGMARTAGMLLREMIPLRGDSMPAASFRHGPLLDAGPDHTLFAMASGHTAGLVHAISAETAAKGSRVLLITDQPAQKLGDGVKVVSVPDLGEECFCHLALQIIEQYIAATVERHGTQFVLEVTTSE